jgi:hypothetical protein
VIAHIFTHDVTNCYTNIPQDDLVERLIDWLRKFWDLHPNTAYIKVSETKGAKWLTDLPPQGLDFYCQAMRSRVHVFDLHTATLLVTLIVMNAYVQCGTNIYRQVNGIPMGASCSPKICDMYLLSYEYAFFERLVAVCQTDAHRHTATKVLRPSPSIVGTLMTASP